MDPTFAHSMRLYLAALDEEHKPADDGTAICRCGDVMPEGRDRHLLELIAAAFVEPELAPHVVHVKGAFVAEEPVDMIDEEDQPRRDEKGRKVKMTGRRYEGPTNCPDCTRGLVSRGHDMICSQLSRDVELRGCHEGCLVACGREA